MTFLFKDGLEVRFGDYFDSTEVKLKLGCKSEEQDLAFRCTA